MEKAFKEELGRHFDLLKVERGRFAEEENITLTKGGKKLLYIKAFYGRKPYWREWVEVFNIEPQFFGSPDEDKLYSILAKYFRRVFVEYYEDTQTMLGLKSGKEPQHTRLGIKLKDLGYRYFRDWYYPEGWMEGGYKLQAEK